MRFGQGLGERLVGRIRQCLMYMQHIVVLIGVLFVSESHTQHIECRFLWIEGRCEGLAGETTQDGGQKMWFVE